MSRWNIAGAMESWILLLVLLLVRHRAGREVILSLARAALADWN